MLRLRSCLPALNRLQLRVVVLRAGLGEARPQRRARVARILDISHRRVERVERRALRGLRRADRGGRCGSAQPGAAVALTFVRTLFGGGSSGDGATVLADQGAPPAGSGDPAPAPDGSGADDAVARHKGGVKGQSESSNDSPPPSLTAPAPPGGEEIPLWVPLLLLAALVVLVTREVLTGLSNRRAVRRYRGTYGD